MSRRPDTATLLQAGRRAVLDLIEPDMPGDRKYRMLMVANAFAIALRDLAGSDAPDDAELDLFELLYGAGTVTAAGADPAARLVALNRRLAGEIRDGQWDELSQPLMDLLLHQVRTRISRSNPKYFKRSPEG